VRRFVFSIAWVAALGGVARPARAEWTAGASLGALLPFGEAETNVGWGVDASGGYRLHLASITLGPELGVGYGVYTPIASARKALGFGHLGARLGLDFVPSVTPYAFARLGYGVASTTNFPDPNQGRTFSSGAFVDLGLGVSRRVGKAFEIGLEAGYATIEPGGCFCARWFHGGAAGAFLF
jgi:hypothetical protein